MWYTVKNKFMRLDIERLNRKIDTFLIEWKNTADKFPLIVKGARQIGKTEAIKHFAESHY